MSQPATHRYGVLQTTPEGTRLVGTANRLQTAVEVWAESPSYEIYDYERHEFVHPPVASTDAGRS